MEFSLHLPLSLKMQGNEVEAVKTPTVRSWEIYIAGIEKQNNIEMEE